MLDEKCKGREITVCSITRSEIVRILEVYGVDLGEWNKFRQLDVIAGLDFYALQFRLARR